MKYNHSHAEETWLFVFKNWNKFSHISWDLFKSTKSLKTVTQVKLDKTARGKAGTWKSHLITLQLLEWIWHQRNDDEWQCMSVQGVLEDKSCLQQTLFDPLQRFGATYKCAVPLRPIRCAVTFYWAIICLTAGLMKSWMQSLANSFEGY